MSGYYDHADKAMSEPEDDLVERLRTRVTVGTGIVTLIRLEAADHIEAQAKLIEGLVKALDMAAFRLELTAPYLRNDDGRGQGDLCKEWAKEARTLLASIKSNRMDGRSPTPAEQVEWLRDQVAERRGWRLGLEDAAKVAVAQTQWRGSHTIARMIRALGAKPHDQ